MTHRRFYIQATATSFAGRYVAGWNMGVPVWSESIGSALLMTQREARAAWERVSPLYQPRVWAAAGPTSGERSDER